MAALSLDYRKNNPRRLRGNPKKELRDLEGGKARCPSR